MKQYNCVKCETAHALPSKAGAPQEVPGAAWGDQPKEVREWFNARHLYKDHRRYAEGSQAGEALRRLREWIKPGDTLLMTIPHVAPSGMSRHIRVAADGKPEYYTPNVAWALGYPLMPDDSLRIGGCGMDMTFALADELAHALWPKGYACPGVKNGCPHPARGHWNGKTNDPHAEWNKEADAYWHRADGNYSLRRRVI